MRIRRSKVNPCRAQKSKKEYILVSLEFIFLGEIKHFANHIKFAYLIKGTALGQALWGANTFLARNRLPYPTLVVMAKVDL